MTRMKVVLLSLLAVFAIGAVASASASAFSKEWQVCKEAGTEEFETNKCAKKASGGKFSWVSLTGTESLATTSTGGAFELKAGVKTIKCTAVTDKGNIKAAGADEATEIKFTGCTTGQAGCNVKSAGEPNGTIT